MNQYRVGHIFTRCFLQKRLVLSDSVEVLPLPATGTSGAIHDARRLLQAVGFSFTSRNLQATLANFDKTGAAVCVTFEDVSARTFAAAIESVQPAAERIAGALAVVSANPAVPLCAFAENPHDSGVNFYIPNDRIIRHGTNIAGFLDAVPDQISRAEGDAKFALLLRLFQASLREPELDYRMLFQLILLEEASDRETGTFAELMREFAVRHGFVGDLDAVAAEVGVTLPAGKDVVDVLVKLRNSAAHNGRIDAESLIEFGGGWVVPLLADKTKLHKLVTDALRYMFCALVGHTRDLMATKVTGDFTIQFGGDE